MSAARPVWLHGGEGDWRLQLMVQPGATRSEAVGVHGDRLRVRVQAPPVDGRANRALCEWLARRLGVAASRVRVVAGESGRRKTVSVDAPLSPQAIAAIDGGDEATGRRR